MDNKYLKMNKHHVYNWKSLISLLLLSSMFIVLLGACSTTKNLPEGEVLYTGIKDLEVTDPDGSDAGDTAMQEVESALSYPPNNSLFGSSTMRIPFPIGLWIYNRYVNSESGFGRWMFDKFAAKPVFITTVNPDVRVAVAHNLLRENGYFNGNSTYEVIPDEKNPRKAKISYNVTMNNAYTYDSIRYMRMRHYADTLINANMDDRLINKGDNFNVVQLEAERQRISTLLRNNGFHYFRPDFMVYQADTLLTPGKVWLRVTRAPGLPSNALRPYRIGNMSINLSGFESDLPTDSLLYKDLMIYYQGKLRVRPAVLYGRFTFKPGDLYKQEEQQRTQTGLSRLSTFQYTEFQYTPQDTARRSRNDLLNLRVNAVYDLPLDGELEFNVKTKDNDYAGPGAVFGVTRRNAFRGGEVLNVQLRGSYEWQTGNRGNAPRINSYEIGLSSTVTLPFILFPGYIYRDLIQPSSTTFRLSADLLNRATFFKMYSFGGSMAYDFRPTATMRHSVTPFRLTFNKVYPTEDFKKRLEENRGLALSLQDQFIPAMGYTFTYDSSPFGERNTYWWQTSVTQSGNIIGGIYAIAGKDFNKKEKQILGNPFSQFIKGTTEFRYNYQIDRNNRLVARVMAGAIYSYGNSRVAPYSEQFYVGGANSIRAFTIRSIGPGRYIPDDPDDNPYSYIDQTGDLKFEANLEYRFKIVGDLNGAVFLDSGGIWLMKEDPDRPGGRLKKGHFFKDLATGTGLGVRYDLDFLVVRLDVGIGLHLPYDTGKSGYYNIPKFSDGLGWHLAIGYPF